MKRFPKASLVLVAIILLVVGVSCANWPHRFIGTFPAQVIEEVVLASPLDLDQNIRVTPLATSESSSHFVVQIRHAEELHLHKEHDLTVFVCRGFGRMEINRQVIQVHKGDIIYIRRGTPHRFANQSRHPAVAVVVFSPKLEEKDSFPVSP